MRLDPAARAVIDRLAGTGVTGFSSRAGGNTRAITGLVTLADGRQAFVKTATPGTPSDDPLVGDLHDEIAVLRRIAASPAAPYVPTLIGAADDGDLPLLLAEDLSGASWPPPYPADLAPLRDALDALAAVAPPASLTALEDAAAADGLPWAGIAADPVPIIALGVAEASWLEAAVPTLRAAEARADLAGDQLVHGDLWYANICFAARGPVIVDWSSAMRGNPMLDRATLTMDLLEEGCDPRLLEIDDPAAWLALLVGHQARAATLPLDGTIDPSSPLRAEQAETARLLLPYVARLLGLPEPLPLPHTRR